MEEPESTQVPKRGLGVSGAKPGTVAVWGDTVWKDQAEKRLIMDGKQRSSKKKTDSFYKKTETNAMAETERTNPVGIRRSRINTQTGIG